MEEKAFGVKFEAPLKKHRKHIQDQMWRLTLIARYPGFEGRRFARHRRVGSVTLAADNGISKDWLIVRFFLQLVGGGLGAS